MPELTDGDCEEAEAEREGLSEVEEDLPDEDDACLKLRAVVGAMSTERLQQEQRRAVSES